MKTIPASTAMPTCLPSAQAMVPARWPWMPGRSSAPSTSPTGTDSMRAERPEVTATTTRMPSVISSLVPISPTASMANMALDMKSSVP